MRSSFSGGVSRRAPLALAAAGGGCRCCRGCRASAGLFASLVDQFPQFVQSFARDRRNRQHGVSNTDSSSLSARIRSPRASLSILVATTAARSDRVAAATATPRGRSPAPDAARRPAAAPPAAARTPPGRSPRTRLAGAPRASELVAPVSTSTRRSVAARVAVAREIHAGRTARRRHAPRGRRSRAASCRARRSCAPPAGGPAR